MQVLPQFSMEEKDKPEEKSNRWVLYSIDKEVKSELKIYAYRNDTQIGKVVNEILKDWIDKHKNEPFEKWLNKQNANKNEEQA